MAHGQNVNFFSATVELQVREHSAFVNRQIIRLIHFPAIVLFWTRKSYAKSWLYYNFSAGKINARAECGGIQRTWFFTKIYCVNVTEYQSTFHLRPQRSLRLITLFGCRQL